MSIRPIVVALVGAMLSAAPASAGNLFHVKEGTLRSPWTFQMWGFQVPGTYTSLPAEPLAYQAMLREKVEHGLNTVTFCLQDPVRGAAFFAPDGRPRSEEVRENFTKLTSNIRNHYMGTLVGLFSADRTRWLESADAYQTACRTVAEALPNKHSTILVVGDLFNSQDWPEDSPYPVGDLESVYELCRIIRKTREDTLPAIPARIVPGARREDLIYVGQTVDALQAFIEAVQSGEDPRKKTGDAVAIPANHVLLFGTMKRDHYEALLRDFMTRVEKDRTSMKIPGMPADPDGPKVDLDPQEEADGFRLLFDGRSLENFTTLVPNWGAWRIEEGTIHCHGVSGPWLRTRERFSSFILRLQFKIEKNGNSGVFIWAPLDARASRFGMEMQIRGRQFKPVNADTTGAIYDVRGPSVDATRPAGEWNDVEIACRGSHVQIRINGKLVQDFDADEIPKLKPRLRSGVIGLQDHNDNVWFRNIRIKKLDRVTGTGNAD